MRLKFGEMPFLFIFFTEPHFNYAGEANKFSDHVNV